MELNIAEIPYEGGVIQYRYARYLSEDGSRWIRHGLFCAYHPNGNLASEGSYIDGQEHGMWTDYHLNGNYILDKTGVEMDIQTGQAGAKIEITPAMVQAGVTYLQDSGRLSLDQDGLDHLLVRKILGVSLAASPRFACAVGCEFGV